MSCLCALKYDGKHRTWVQSDAKLSVPNRCSFSPCTEARRRGPLSGITSNVPRIRLFHLHWQAASCLSVTMILDPTGVLKGAPRHGTDGPQERPSSSLINALALPRMNSITAVTLTPSYGQHEALRAHVFCRLRSECSTARA